MQAPQDPSTLPKSSVPPSKPMAKPATNTKPLLTPHGTNEWTIAGAWQLIAAPSVKAEGMQISQAGFQPTGWLDATVPGTVLTTYVDRGVYPDPDYGLNNLAIPETLNKQDYWYRTQFAAPASAQNKHLTLTFNGINYMASVWMNGKYLGDIKGAFIRGSFDVTGVVAPAGMNYLAVRISPPLHPGIAHEQSVKGGPGENGGIMCLDGPTFVATEGWDWIPGVRDRNTGIWQDVTLTATGPFRIGDAQVVTKLPLPDTSRADLTISVPLRDDAASPVNGTLKLSFEGVNVTKTAALAPGDNVLTLTPSEFPQLTVSNPRLWWPNGYGRPDLYHAQISFSDANGNSDSKPLRFGIREVSYELSLANDAGSLSRVEFSPTAAKGERVVDGTHEGIVQSSEGWVASLRPHAEQSPAIHRLDDARPAPYLVIRVNGTRIASKGGNWGMDDSRKRVSREHLEPFFRLHRDANLNIIRNWVGQNTEEVFYDLADEYGLMVWNDFWGSTQNYNLEPDDSALFLANARDTIMHFRNHPSIVIWCGRNEGVPSPAVNRGLDDLVRTLDGTRYYTGSSNQVNLQNSGPYRYRPPAEYFTKLARGFAVELGVPSMPTLEAFQAMVPQADQWPPNDTWAYHDWHRAGNGDVAPFMSALEEQFGAATNLEDFERKAQMMNYVDHRAIFEGFNAHLWTPNSGRMLWMTQPAWPSTMWQILSSDYDTQASYYAVKKASESVHVQLNLPDLKTAVVNNTSQPLSNLKLLARVFSSDGNTVSTREETLDVAASAESDSFAPDLGLVAASDVLFVKLELRDHGKILSDNFYWYAEQSSSYRKLNQLEKVKLTVSATQLRSGDWIRVNVTLANPGKSVAVMSKLTIKSAADGSRVLPAYASDNYVSLIPGETRTIQVECPATAVKSTVEIGIDGWNVTPETIHPQS